MVQLISLAPGFKISFVNDRVWVAYRFPYKGQLLTSKDDRIEPVAFDAQGLHHYAIPEY